MRKAIDDRSTEIAEAAISFMDKGVVGFDIAGPELIFLQEFTGKHLNSSQK
ncbi:MAG: hypothetical protein Ct9H90mP5_01490 [Acidimicrobiaceae bacterium]|nr:MAG: hypothetical protein Ct9H90mP5_01490 [Acidimicrobiaceae bacterium]